MKQKLLLIKPSYNFFPIGLAHIMTALDRHGMDYDFTDLLRCSHDWRADVESGKYYAVATGGLTGDMDDMKDVSETVKRLNPEIPVIIGGKIVTDMPDAILYDKIRYDYALDGEGEHTLPALLESIQSGTVSPETIHGLVYYSKSSNKMIKSHRPKPISLAKEDLYPTWDRIDVDHYLEAGIGGFPGFRAFPVLTGRGCTGRCTFCSPTNGSFRMRDIEHVIRELHGLNDRYDFEGFAFANEILYPTSKLIRRFLEAYRDSGINKPWVCLLRVDIDETILRDMKDSGCVGISYGVESGSDNVLKQLKKNTTVRKITDFTRTVKRLGIPAFGSFMLGNDGETEQELNQTIDFVIHEDIAGPSALMLAYPGTEIYAKALSTGLIPDEKAYVDALDFSNLLGEGTYKNSAYVNVSAMPGDRFFDIILSAYRRYITHRYRVNQAVNVDLDSLTAECPVCGRPQDIPFRIDSILGMECFCKTCFHSVYYNFYETDRFKAHKNQLIASITQANRVFLHGTGINSRLVHLYDIFSLDITKIAGVISEEKDRASGYFFNAPLCTMDNVSLQDNDCVIIADTFNRKNVENQWVQKGLDPKRVISLMPSDWLVFIRDLYQKTSAERMNRLFEQGLTQTTPQPDTEGFHVLMADLGEKIKEHLQQSRKTGLYLMPAGGFGIKAAESLEQMGIQISGFIDNFKWKTQTSISGKTVFSPESVEHNNHGILLATPSYQVQLGMKEQMCGSNSFSGEAVLLLGDLIIKRELESEG